LIVLKNKLAKLILTLHTFTDRSFVVFYSFELLNLKFYIMVTIITNVL
jgi:hypothetical protein